MWNNFISHQAFFFLWTSKSGKSPSVCFWRLRLIHSLLKHFCINKLHWFQYVTWGLHLVTLLYFARIWKPAALLWSIAKKNKIHHRKVLTHCDSCSVEANNWIVWLFETALIGAAHFLNSKTICQNQYLESYDYFH